MFTGEMLARWAEMALEKGAKYWYGTCWYEADESLLTRKAEQYPAHYTAGRMATYRKHVAEGRMVCDCVGLIKGFFWTANGTQENKYRANNCPDTSANGMIKLCTETGTLSNMPEERGLILWRSGHVGVYIGNGKVIEARGFKYGVVKTNLHSRGWQKWGRLPEVMLNGTTTTTGGGVTTNANPLLKKGAIGDSVEKMQKLLIAWNAKALPKYGADGDFGKECYDWVKKFQQAHGLAVDGIVGLRTWEALLKYNAAIPAGQVQLPTVREGDKGEYVKKVQRSLIAWNSKALPKHGADGDFGGETDEWVRKFQKAHGLTVDGIVGKNTWAALPAVFA